MSLVFNMAGGAAVKLVALSIKTPPSKTAYTEGEKFSASGMVVQATYSNGVTATVTSYSYSPTGALTTSNTAIAISYTEGGVTVTATQSITVKKAYDATFANNDWSTIIDACQTKSVPSSWVVGNSKTMTINGTSYQIDIIGKNHDTYASGGTAPLTFQMHDCYAENQFMYETYYNDGGWAATAMRNTHLPNILSCMPSEVRNGIKAVNKLSSAGNLSTAITTTADKLFLLSEVEVFGSASYSVSGEGSHYAYYAAGNSKFKYKNGSSQSWGLRSAHKSNRERFLVVHAGVSSSQASSSDCYTKSGVAFAFCF